MLDTRLTRLADTIVNYSCSIKSCDHVWINAGGIEPLLVNELIRLIGEKGGRPIVRHGDSRVTRQLLLHSSEEQLQLMAETDRALMEKMQVYIGLSGGDNISELSDVPADKMKMYNQIYVHPVHYETRLKKSRWVVLRYPTPAMAQLANMNTEAFEDFYFKVCTLDYAEMEQALNPLKDLMERTDRVHLVGPGTDLSFSIKGIGAVKCSGKSNLPDGEVYTAPVKHSVNGVISFNTPSPYQGYIFENVHLEFENGKIVKATANDTARINKILDTDEGARYLGEFSLGLNPYILHPMKDILFDEKISGSFHVTPGNSYEDAFNGNVSAIHWDLVSIQRSDYGGGEVWFDGTLIRKNGRFVLPELQGLNQENFR